MFNQTFEPHDLFVVGILIVLEGVLSIDNALVLGLLARRLPKHLQPRALTYGLVGAFVFRIIAIGTATYLLEWRVAKLLGGAYLMWVALKHFVFESNEEKTIALDEDGKPILVGGESTEAPPAAAISTHAKAFWMTVGVIELTDIAFAVDSIVAAIALVGAPPPETPRDALHPKLWVVVTGGMLGVILMRFAAVIFIRLLEKFPRFETAAYLLVIVIGGKLIADWAFNTASHPHRLDFHDPEEFAFWCFWVLMLICFSVGFIPLRRETLAK